MQSGNRAKIKSLNGEIVDLNFNDVIQTVSICVVLSECIYEITIFVFEWSPQRICCAFKQRCQNSLSDVGFMQFLNNKRNL